MQLVTRTFAVSESSLRSFFFFIILSCRLFFFLLAIRISTASEFSSFPTDLYSVGDQTLSYF